MRGVIRKLPGIGKIDVSAGKAEITVAYNPEVIDVDKQLAGKEAGGQSAKRR